MHMKLKHCQRSSWFLFGAESGEWSLRVLTLSWIVFGRPQLLKLLLDCPILRPQLLPLVSVISFFPLFVQGWEDLKLCCEAGLGTKIREMHNKLCSHPPHPLKGKFDRCIKWFKLPKDMWVRFHCNMFWFPGFFFWFWFHLYNLVRYVPSQGFKRQGFHSPYDSPTSSQTPKVV